MEGFTGLPYSSGISVNPIDGSCWVADSGALSVVKLDAVGNEVVRVGGFDNPNSISVNPTDGSCWVADRGALSVVKLDANGNELVRVEGIYPGSVFVNPVDGSCWVTGWGWDSVIIKLDSDGNELVRVGGFTGAGYLSINTVDGSCWVASETVVKLEPSGYVDNGAWLGTYASGEMEHVWGTLEWQAYVPAGTTVRFTTRSADTTTNPTEDDWSTWSEAYPTSGSAIASPAGGWLQVRCELGSDGLATPTVTSIQLMPASGVGEQVIWQNSITPIDLQAGTVQTYSQQLPTLNETGQYKLVAELICPQSGQVIATTETSFLVTEAEVAVLLLTGKTIYKPSEQVNVTGTVVNRTALDVSNIELEVSLDGNVVYSETFDLLANESTTFSFVTTAPEEDGTLTAILSGPVTFETSRPIRVDSPAVQMTLEVPAVVSREPFTAILTLENTSEVPAELVLDFVGQQQTIIIPAGQSWTAVETLTINQDTTVTATISGDVNDEISVQVIFGENVVVQVLPQSTYLGGIVPIPYTVSNQGQFDSQIEINFALTGQAELIETILVPMSQMVGSELVYDLPAGDYTLNYTQPFGQGSVDFRVVDSVEIILSLDTVTLPDGSIEATVTVRNDGPLDFSGFVSLDLPFWAIDESLEMNVGQEEVFVYIVQTAAAEPGEYSLTAIIHDDQLNPVTEQTSQITVSPADIQLVSVPGGLEFDAGGLAEFDFVLQNVGGQPGRVDVQFTFETIDRTQLVWLELGEERTISFSAYLPDDLEDNQYYGRLSFNGAPIDIPLKVNGVKIQTDAAMDKIAYAHGDTVLLDLNVTNVGLVEGVDLFAKVNYGEYEDTKPFILADQQQIHFAIPLDEINGQKLAYGIYFGSGRSLWLDSVYLRSVPSASDEISLVTDRDVYLPGETVNVTVLGDQTGSLIAETPGFSDTVQIIGETLFSFDLPEVMTQGTYFINWTFGEQHGALPFDVAGILVRILECRLDQPRYYPGQELNTTLLLDFGQLTDIRILGQIRRPDGTAVDTFDISGTYEAGLVSIDCTSIVDSPFSGIHRLYYQILEDSSVQLLAAGMEAFDVGNGSIVSLKMDKSEYLLGEEMRATVGVVGHNVGGILQLYIDGEQVWQQQLQFSGYQNVEAQISGVATGDHVLEAILTTDELISRCEALFSVVSNVPPMAVDDAYVTDEDTQLTVAALSVLGNDGDGDGDPLTAVLDIGPSSGILTLSADGSFSYMPDANFNGSDSFTYRANDGFADSNIATVSITVNSINDAPQLDAGPDQSVNEGQTVNITATFTDPDSADTHTAIIDWGDGIVEPGIVDEAVGDVTGYHVYADDDIYTVIVTVTDNNGTSGDDDLLVTVNNVAPTVIAGPDQAVDEGTVVTLNPATFNDLGTLDTHTATIDWGDGTPAVVGTVSEIPSGPPGSTAGADGAVAGSHIYADNGVYTVNITVYDDDGASTSDTFTITVLNVAPAVYGYPQTQIAQYSDSILPVSITVSDDGSTDTLSATISWSNDGSNFTPGLPDAGTIDGGIVLGGPTNGTGSLSLELSGISDIPPGEYTIRVTVDDDDGGSTDQDIALVIMREDAAVTYTGVLNASTITPVEDEALVFLAATIRDIADAETGDITNARIRFFNRDTGAYVSPELTPVLVDPADPTVATVSYLATLSLPGNSSGEPFTIGMVVSGIDLGQLVGGDLGFIDNGFYERNSTEGDVVVNVYRNEGEFITGGGYTMIENPMGEYAPDPGSRTNFGFNVKFNKKGTNLKGKVNIIFRRTESDGLLHVYQIKSNAIDSLGVPPDSDPDTGTATFTSKANLQDVTDPLNPISLGGNLSFQMMLTDMGEPGSSDSIGIAVYNSSGGLLFSSEWDSVQTIEKLLSGGNVVVHDADALTVSGEGPLPATNVMNHLSQSDLETSVPTAVEFWRAAGVDPSILGSLNGIEYRVEDLAGAYLGLAYPSAGLVLIDETAADYGWDNIDVLSVLSHELGHIMGFEHDDPYDVMAPVFVPGAQDTLIEIRGPPADMASSLTTPDLSTYATLDGSAEMSDVEGIYQLNATNLPGLQLVNPDISSWEGQIIYLDFDGEQDVTYNGPVVVEGIDVPEFSAEFAGLAGQEQEIISQILAALDHEFEGTSILFTTSEPESNTSYSTVFIGGDGAEFREYSFFVGLAEKVDTGNQDSTDNAFVFSDVFAREISSSETLITHMVDTITHEIGHLLGYEHHYHQAEQEGTLSSVAVEYVVDSLLDNVVQDGELTLREALEAANTNTSIGDAVAGSSEDVDIIRFDGALAGDTILLGGELTISDDVIIEWLEAETLSIDADNNSRVLSINSDVEVVITGLLLTGGYSDGEGGGVHNSGTLTLTSTTVSGNSAINSGGGIWNGGTLTLMDTTITDNSATGSYYGSSGGGIYNAGTLTLMSVTITDNSATGSYYGGNGSGIYNAGTLTLTDTTVSGNSASHYGGGISNGNGTLTLTNCTVTSNWAGDGGGGIYNYGTSTLTNATITDNSTNATPGYEYYGGGGILNYNGTLTLTNCTVTDNSSSNSGGGIYNVNGTLTLTNVTISSNSSATGVYGGGAIYNNGTLTLTDTTVSGNSTGISGGGIFNSYIGTLTLTNTTVSGNSASGYGGGICSYGTLTLTNTTVSGNSSSSPSGGIYNNSGMSTLNNTIVYLNEGQELFGDYSGSHNLIGIDPGFIRNPNDGGDGWGVGDNDDYGDLRLTSSSIAINLGDNALAVDAENNPLATDLAGNARIAEATVDIGAYEFHGTVDPDREVSSTVVTTLTDVVDTTDGQISLREALVTAWYGGLGNEVAFDVSLAGGTIILSDNELYIYESVTVDGSAIGGITLDAGGQFRVVSIQGSIEVSFIELTLSGGNSSSGGGIFNVSGTLALTNCTISSNSSSSGGGIYNVSGALTLTNSTISGNSSSSYSSSHSSSGGGIYNDSGTLTLMNSTISGNSSSSYYSYSPSSGGGIYNDSGMLILTNSTISGNSSYSYYSYSSYYSSYGGGIYNVSGTLILTNCMISGNSTSSTTLSYGGGIYNDWGMLTLTNCTVSGNSSSSGGGIANISGAVALNNSIVALNIASDNDILGGFMDSNSLISIDPGFVLNPSAGDDGQWGTVDDDPGDMHLLPDSPCMDAGLDALAVDAEGNPLSTDLDGQPRFVGVAVDIGAYEYSSLGEIDLRVSHVSAPVAVRTGETFIIDWIVSNYSATTDTPETEWHDEVRLSRDASWGGEDDVIIGTWIHAGGLGAGAVYNTSVDVDPSAIPGGISEDNYYILVRTDVTGAIAEANESNNTCAAANLLTVGIQELVLGEPMEGSLPGNWANRYYSLNLTEAGMLYVVLNDTNNVGSNELYIRYGQPPTRIAYDYRYTANLAADQRITIPEVIPGTYYVMVYGSSVPDAPAEFTLTASIVSFVVMSTDFGTGGTEGDYTIKVLGVGFDHTVTARITNAVGFQLSPKVYHYESQTELYITFDLSGMLPGNYDVVFTKAGEAEIIVPQSLTVAVTVSPEAVIPRVIVPSAIRRGREFSFTVEWENTSLNDVLVPLLTVGCTVPFGLDHNDYSLGTRYTFLGVNTQGGLAGVLRPGQRETMTFWAYSGTETGDYNVFVDRNGKDQSAPFDWESLRPSLIPAGMDDNEFDPIFQQLVSQVGLTWGDYLAMLTKNASSLAGVEDDIRNPLTLLHHERDRAWARSDTGILGYLIVPPSMQLGGLTIKALNQTTGYSRMTKSDNFGAFSFPALDPGAYVFSVPGALVDSPTPLAVVLAPGQSFEPLAIHVSHGAKLSLTVLGSQQQPVNGAAVALLSEVGEVLSGVTDASGIVDIPGVAIGNYAVRVMAGNIGFALFLDVVVDQDDVSVTLDLAAGTVSGVVVDENGIFVPDLTIGLVSTLGPLAGIYPAVSQDSIFSVMAPSGSYELRVMQDGQALYTSEAFDLNSGQSIDFGEIVIGTLTVAEAPISIVWFDDVVGFGQDNPPSDEAIGFIKLLGYDLQEVEEWITGKTITIFGIPIPIPSGIDMIREYTNDEFAEVAQQFVASYPTGDPESRDFGQDSQTVKGEGGPNTILKSFDYHPFANTLVMGSENDLTGIMAIIKSEIQSWIPSENPVAFRDWVGEGRYFKLSDFNNIDSWYLTVKGGDASNQTDWWKIDPTLVGGVGHWGDPPPDYPLNLDGLNPDARSLDGDKIGCVLLTSNKEGLEILVKELEFTAEDAFDFWPGNLGSMEEVHFATTILAFLEINQEAFDVPVNVNWIHKGVWIGYIDVDWGDGKDPAKPEPGDPLPDDSKPIRRPASYDPNEKIGLAAHGPDGFVLPDLLMPYTIYFENDPDLATAPAQEVRISDTLDANLDWSTFELIDIAFGDHMISVPSGLNYYATTFDLRPYGTELLVEIEAGLDPSTGEVFWSFVSLDPKTLALPADPFAGFLPVNDATGRGEGHVSYLIYPQAGLQTGTEITNDASIVFDVNEPIVTNEVLNTLDAGPPTSQVDSLPTETTEIEFTVSWSGQDDAGGSGITGYDIYVSDNGGPFELWLDSTTDTSAVFAGEHQHTYAFYSIATDNVGHAESAPDVPDAETMVLAENIPPEVDVGPDATVDEGEAFIRTGSFDDPDPSDSWTATVDYGDGSGAQPLALNPDKTFVLSHAYADNDPYIVTVIVTDYDDAFGFDTLVVTVLNVAPILVLEPVAMINENGTAMLAGTITDPGTLDTFILEIDWGDPLSPNNLETYVFGASETGSQTFTLTHQYLDDNPSSTSSDPYTISVTVTDNVDPDHDTVTVEVANVAPEITEFSSSATLSDRGVEGEPISISASFVDIGTLDTHTAQIDWGDGAITAGFVTESGGGGTVTGTHVYATGGIFTVAISLQDDDTGIAAANTTAVIIGVGVVDNQLHIVGTDDADSVSVAVKGGKNPKVVVDADFLGPMAGDFNKNSKLNTREFDAAGITSVLIMLYGGDDLAIVSEQSTLDAIIDGGSGDDKLHGGAGNDILLGGEGDDQITGDGGADILIGGLGVDRLVGGTGDDILVSDQTVYESDESQNKLPEIKGLAAIQSEWLSGKNYFERLNNITGNDPQSDRFNNDFFLGFGLTIWDDGQVDKLTGGRGKDWFLFSGDDWAVDIGGDDDDELIY
ncbi:PKD domain-containing protein [Planctomycetota bacterium]